FACTRNMDCHYRHNNGVSEARPCRESDQAAMRGWVTSCQEQEDPQGDIEAKHHRCRVLVVRLPSSPYRRHQWINASHKEKSQQHQHSLEYPLPAHSGPPAKTSI